MQNHLFKNFSESLNTQIPQVYLDMDGVLADFFGYFDKITGKDYKELNGNQVLFNELSKKFIEGTDFFAKIPAHRSLSLIMSTIKLIFGKYNILSAPLVNDVDNTIKNKNIWLDNNMAEFLPDVRIYTREKEKFATNNIANILIDDNLNNLKKWVNAGGIGIKFKANSDKYSTIDLASALLKILSSSDFVTPRIIYLYDFVNYSKGEVKHLDLIDKLINNGTSNNEILKSEIIKYFNYLNDNENINTELLFNCQRHDLHENLMLLSLEELIAFYKSLEN